MVQGLLEFLAIFALDATAHATATGVVGHQHHVATGQTHEGGQGRAFVAALFFFHLDQELLAFFDHVLDARLRGRGVALEVLARDFFEGQKAVTLFTVVHKAGLQRGLDAGDHGFVDIAFALFAPFDFDFVVEEFLSIDNGQAALFGLRGVDQHAFHFISFVSRQRLPRTGEGKRTGEELPESH